MQHEVFPDNVKAVGNFESKQNIQAGCLTVLFTFKACINSTPNSKFQNQTQSHKHHKYTVATAEVRLFNQRYHTTFPIQRMTAVLT